MIYRPKDIETLSRTIYGEARGESRKGKIAVAHVVMNRLKSPGWWTRQRGDGIPDDTVEAACRDPWQFSCWNESDPNRGKLLSVTPENKRFQNCLEVAAAVLAGLESDPTYGACHYHTLTVHPKWAVGKQPKVVIGAHAFYVDID